MLDHAAEVARQFESFGAYGRSRVKARAALRRRAPGFSNEQYGRAIAKATTLFSSAREIASANEAELINLSRVRGTTWGSYPHLLRAAVPGFPLRTYEWVIAWVVYWYHLR